MDAKAKGWILFVAAVGLFCTMVTVDIGQLQEWESATQPKFVAKIIGYIGTVIGSFVAGKLMPT